MHLVAELFFDKSTEEAVRSMWREIRDAGIPGAPDPVRARPHLSIAVFKDLDVARFRTRLARFAMERAPVDISLSSWGAFFSTESVVFLAPTVTVELLALHRGFQERFTPWGDSSDSNYHPGNWVPHCTLAAGFPSREFPGVVEVCHRVVRPLRGRIEGIGLAEYVPRHEHASYPLGSPR